MTGTQLPPGAVPAPRSNIPTSRSLVRLLVGGALLTTIYIGLTSSTITVEVLAPAAAFALIALVAIDRERRRYGPAGVASPLSLYAIFWFVYLGLMGIGAAGLASNSTFGLTNAALVRSLWLAVFALLLFALGYTLITRIVLRAPPLFTGHSAQIEDCPPYAIAATLIVGWLAILYLFSRHQYGYLQYGTQSSGLVHFIISLAANLVPLALVALVFVGWSDGTFPSLNRRTARVILALNIIPLALVSIGSGFKGQLVQLLLPAGIAYLLLRGRVPWKAVVLVAIYLVITYGGLQQYRSDIAAGQFSSAQTAGVVSPTRAALSNIITSWATQNPANHVQQFWRGITQEYSNAPQTMAIIESQTPSAVPYLGLRRFLSGPLFFLPVTTFQGNFELGLYVAETYHGATTPTSAPPTQVGDFYMSGGFPVVVVGEVLVGVLLGCVWRLLAPSGSRFRSTLLYAMLAVSFANLGQDFSGMVRYDLGLFVIYGSMIRVLFPVRSIRQTKHARSYSIPKSHQLALEQATSPPRADHLPTIRIQR